MFKIELFELCHKRQCWVNLAHIAQFNAQAQELGILPNGGIMMQEGQEGNPLATASQCFYLNKPLTLEEASYIATFKERKGVFDYLMSKGYSPFRALAELDLL